MKKTKLLISVSPPRIGGIDFLLPLFFELKKENPKLKIILLILDKKLRYQLKDNEFLMEQLKLIDVRFFFINWKKINISFLHRFLNIFLTYFYRIIIFYKFFKIFLNLLVISPAVFIHTRFENLGILSLFVPIIKLRNGKIYNHENTMTIYHGRKMLSKNKNKSTDAILHFSSCNIRSTKKNTCDKKYIIGYPKLYSGWSSHVKSIGLEYKNKLLKNYKNKDKKIISLFLTSIVPNIIDKEDYENWLSEIFSSIEKTFSNRVILIKPHPPVNRYRDIINKIAFKFKLKNFFITDLHPGVIASASDICISAHSSVIIDIMGVGTKVVFHQKFTKKWMMRHPEKSSFLHLKIPHSESQDQLISILKNLDHIYHDTPDVRRQLNHIDNHQILLTNEKTKF